MKYGFHFFLCGKDYFVETQQTRKTTAFALKILPLIGCSVTEGNAKALIYRMRPAVCEIKEINGRKCYDIHGENFGGCGSWADDGETVILTA